MTWLDRLARRLGYAPAKAQPERAGTVLAMAEGQQWSMPDMGSLERQTDLYRTLSWMQIAVSHVAEQAAGTNFSVRQMSGEDTEDIPNHPFELLLHHPNELQSRFEFLVATFSYYKLTGNAYWWLNAPSGGEPAELWVIPSHMMKPVPDGRMFLKGYEYDPGTGVPQLLPVEQICHFRRFNPRSPFVGLSPVEALAIVSHADLAMQRYNANFFAKENAKIPGSLAFADPIPAPDWAQLKADLKEQWGGTSRSGPLLLRSVGAGGVQWLAMGLSQEDMQFLEGRKFTKEEIFAHFAPGLASVLDVNATEANAKSGRATLMEYAVWPALVSVGEKVTNTVLPLYGDNLVGAFDDPRVTDRQLALSEQQAFERTHTVDETRSKFYGDQDLGDARGDLLVAEVNKPPAFGAPPGTVEAPAQKAVGQRSARSDGNETVADIVRWQRKCVKAVLHGKAASSVQFVSEAIPADQYARIAAALRAAQSLDAVKTLFAAEIEGKQSTDAIVALTSKLDQAIETAKELAA